MQFISVTSQVSLSTSFHKRVKKYKEKPHLSKGKESTYLFGRSLIILLNENFIEEKDYKQMQGKISLLFCSCSLFSLYTSSLSSLLLRRFVSRMAQASATRTKRVTGDEPQRTMGRVQRPVVSFPPSFGRTFSSKERRLGTRQISVLVVIERMKRVWQPRLEIRAKTVKTRVNLVPRVFSLSNMAAAAERSDRPFRSFCIC